VPVGASKDGEYVGVSGHGAAEFAAAVIGGSIVVVIVTIRFVGTNPLFFQLAPELRDDSSNSGRKKADSLAILQE
jgi:hypothetical protein